jgi:hypothetical protein
VPQLIEAEYLLWLFSHDYATAEEWLKSSPDAMRKFFTPASIRKRSSGQFRDAEYWSHCELGGHPNPKARVLLRDHSSPFGSHEWPWVDLAQHLARLWSSFRQCALRLGVADYFDAAVLTRADEAIAAWRAQEAPELLEIRFVEE